MLALQWFHFDVFTIREGEMFVIMERSIHATAVLGQVNGALAFELFPPPGVAFLETRPATALFVVYPKGTK